MDRAEKYRINSSSVSLSPLRLSILSWFSTEWQINETKLRLDKTDRILFSVSNYWHPSSSKTYTHSQHLQTRVLMYVQSTVLWVYVCIRRIMYILYRETGRNWRTLNVCSLLTHCSQNPKTSIHTFETESYTWKMWTWKPHNMPAHSEKTNHPSPPDIKENGWQMPSGKNVTISI